MKSPLIRAFMRGHVPAALVVFASLTLGAGAAPVTWDGGSDANAGGTWETTGNWNPDGVPGSGDSVTLGDVTGGTRTVTISPGFPHSAGQLTITQSTGAAVNKLSIGDDLALSSSGATLAITAAGGTGSVVIDIAAGRTFSATRSAASTNTLGGTFNLLGAGSTFLQTSTTAAMATTFSGPVTAAAGSSLKTVGTSAAVTLNGDSSFGTGAKVGLEFAATNGTASFTNNATLSLDGATLTFDWSATGSPANPASGARNYTNTGGWTLKNNASVVLVSSSGSMPTSGGFNTMTGNSNSGTLSLESGSSMVSRTFFNTGTLNLGSSTAGASDATVTLGALVNANNFDITNGATSAGTAAAGTITIKGNAIFGSASSSTSQTAPATFNNGTASSTGSLLDVGDGIVPVTFSISNNYAALNNFSGNTVAVKSGATLLLTSTLTSALTGNVALTNGGTLRQTGKIQFRSNGNLGTRVFTSTGSHLINGTAAVIEALANSGSGTLPAIGYTNNGTLGGSTANDKFTYTNNTGTSSTLLNSLTIAKTGGQFAPGNGSAGSGTSSIGALTFQNVNLTFSGTNTLTFDIGGAAGSGLQDSLSLLGTGAKFTLGGTSSLDIRLVNGLSAGNGTYTLISGTSVVGTFTNLLLNGGAVSTEYTVTYAANSIAVTFAAVPVPEASSFALLLGSAGLAVALVRRRPFRRQQRGIVLVD